MQQQKSYLVPGLLKAGLLQGNQPIYILIINLIKDMKEVSVQMNQYLQTINAFNPYTWVICNQQYLRLEISEVKQILNQFCKNIPLQQLQRIEKLIIVSDSIQLQQIVNVIPRAFQTVLANKIHLVLRLNQLMNYNLDLTQNQIEFLSRINNTYQEEIPFYGRDISEYPIGQSGLPEFLEVILQYYERHDDYLKKQGVFRISGSIQQEQKLIQQFQIRNYSVLDEYEPDVVSTVFKNILCQLKTPIFPYQMYDTLKEADVNISKEGLLEMFKVFFAYMPEVNRKSTKKIAELLFHVAEYESENMMGLYNLSVVFAPCFLRPNQTQLSDFQGAKVVIQHFNLLIQNVENFLQEIKNDQNSQKISL